MLSRRLYALPVLASVVALAAAACGGGSGTTTQGANTSSTDVPADAVAVVNGTAVPRSSFDRFLEQSKNAYEAQGRPFPKTGSQEYESLKSSTVDYLVQRIVLEKEAAALGITVSEADVTKDLDGLIDQYFGGDMKAYEEELKKQGLTQEDVQSDVQSRLISQKLFDRVTKDVTVDEADLKAYYEENTSEFETPESREVAHILVDTKKEAQAIYDELQNGADFATLAKEKSQDPGSADQGGKLTDERGSFVPEFEEVAFSIETGEIAEPVKSDFGWHVITALADTKPASTTPFEEAKTQIEDTVLQQRKNEVMADWVADVTKKYDVVYAPGFQPLADTGVDHSATTAPATTAP